MSAETPLTSGIAIDELDASIRPQDDLFRHVNGAWIARTEIPSDKARYGSFYVLAEEAEKAVRDIIVESQSADPGTEERKVGDLYASFMDEARVQALGAKPIEHLIAEAEKVSSIDAVLETSAGSSAAGHRGSSRCSSTTTPASPSATSCFSSRAGSVFPTSRTTAKRSSPTSAKSTKSSSSGCSRSPASMTSPLARLASSRSRRSSPSHHWDNVATRDSEKTYNPMLWEAANALVGDVDLDIWLNALGVPDKSFDEVVVRQPSFMAGLESVLTADNLDVVAGLACVAGHPLERCVPVARLRASQLRLLRQDPHGHARAARSLEARRLARRGSARRGGRPHLRRAALSRGGEDSDGRARRATSSRRTAQSITTLDWMGAETRARAIDKLDKFTPKIGYPVKWRDYSSLQIDFGRPDRQRARDE